MSQRTSTLERTDTRAPEIVELLGKVERLLEEGQPEKALDAISRAKLKSPWVTNATAVCVLRLGEVKRAADLFRGLTAGPGGVTLRHDAPAVFKTNFATALLAANEVSGCLGVLYEIGDEENPAVEQLRGAIARWKKSLSLWQKLRWYTGDHPDHPVAFDFPLGRIE
jgi:hypothetical protein